MKWSHVNRSVHLSMESTSKAMEFRLTHCSPKGMGQMPTAPPQRVTLTVTCSSAEVLMFVILLRHFSHVPICVQTILYCMLIDLGLLLVQ